MKKYLFFCFGNFTKETLTSILNQVGSCSDKDKMIYQDGDGYIIIHLFSNNSLKSLRNNFTKSLSNMTNCQFLFEDDEYYDKIVSNLKDLFGPSNKEQSLTDYVITEDAKDIINKNNKILEEMNEEWNDELIDFPNDDKIEEPKEDYNFIKKLDTLIRDFIGNEDENTIDDEYCYDNEDTPIIKKINKKYSLDEILDKIGEKGVSSLTKEELNFLNSFSK